MENIRGCSRGPSWRTFEASTLDDHFSSDPEFLKARKRGEKQYKIRVGNEPQSPLRLQPCEVAQIVPCKIFDLP